MFLLVVVATKLAIDLHLPDPVSFANLGSVPTGRWLLKRSQSPLAFRRGGVLLGHFRRLGPRRACFSKKHHGADKLICIIVGVAVVVSGVALLVRRLTSPVLKLISNFDDYFSWFVTMLPIVTGLLMPVRMGVRYETLLAIHIISVAVLMIWLPFGKLGHTFLVFVTRGTTGMVFERRGAKT